MAWEPKLRALIDATASDRRLKIVFRSAPPAENEFVALVRATYPVLGDEYLRFLTVTNGASLWMYELAGSDSSPVRSLPRLAARWKSDIERLRVVPIGEDPSGQCIGVGLDGRVVLFDHRSESASDCVPMATSFASLLDDVLMGPRFLTLFDVPPEEFEDNEWTEIMRERGWLPEIS